MTAAGVGIEMIRYHLHRLIQIQSRDSHEIQRHLLSDVIIELLVCHSGESGLIFRAVIAKISCTSLQVKSGLASSINPMTPLTCKCQRSLTATKGQADEVPLKFGVQSPEGL